VHESVSEQILLNMCDRKHLEGSPIAPSDIGAALLCAEASGMCGIGIRGSQAVAARRNPSRVSIGVALWRYSWPFRLKSLISDYRRPTRRTMLSAGPSTIRMAPWTSRATAALRLFRRAEVVDELPLADHAVYGSHPAIGRRSRLSLLASNGLLETSRR